MKSRPLVLALLTVLAVAGPLLAGSGPAQAAVAPRSCTVLGTPGADTLRGTQGPDVLCGLGGEDVLKGRGGRDVLVGGLGDDDLRGGAGNDENVGGRGDDLCAWDTADDWFRSCTFDHRSPVIEEIEVLTPEVDVTEESQQVVIRIHVTDDTQTLVRWVTLRDSRVEGAHLDEVDRELVDGDAGDGVWEVRTTVPRGFPASNLRLSVRVEDVAGGWADAERSGAVVVDDRDPHALPEVTLLRPTTERPVDTREGAQDVAVSARVLVPESTVVRRGVELCLEHVASVFVETCATDVQLVSGDTHDGVWRGQVRLRPGDRPGEWSPVVRVADRARPDEPFAHVGRWGAGSRWNRYGAPWQPLVGGSDGVVTLSSRVLDPPPVLVNASLPHGEVTRPAEGEAAPLPVEVEALDGGSPIGSVAVTLVPLDEGIQLHGSPGTPLTDGGDGTWRGSVYVTLRDEPQRYAVVLVLRDLHRLHHYGGESARAASQLPVLPLPDGSDPVVTVR